MPHVTLTPEIEFILRNSIIMGNTLILPANLPRPLYEGANKVITNLGGKWNRKASGHVFPKSPKEALSQVLETGLARDKKKDRQAFYTPKELAHHLVMKAEVDGCRVLEPSAGGGSLVETCLEFGAKTVECVEIDPEASNALLANLSVKAAIAECPTPPPPVRVVTADFLTLRPPTAKFDRVVMNPPFTKNQDIKHVTHALKFLAPGGLLAAIVMGDEERPALAEFSEANNGMIWPMGAGRFKESGTDIKTSILIIQH